MFEPEVTKRVKLIHSANPEDKQLENDNRPNDLMQWLIDQASHSTDPIHMSPLNLYNKLVLFNLFATKTLPTFPTPYPNPFL
jgi:hypothetical protein